MTKRKPGTTKADLVDEVYHRHGGLTKNEVAHVVESIFNTMKASLLEGRAVRIKNFGIFEIADRAGRRGVNPTNGEQIFIQPHKGLNFRPARQLKDTVSPVGHRED